MSFFKKIFNKKVDGYIKAYNLEEWWEDNFNEEEKQYITSKFKPLGFSTDGEKVLVEGKQSTRGESKACFLVNLAGWFSTKKDVEVARKMISEALISAEAEESLDKMATIDKHFYYAQLLNFYYSDRENEESFSLAIEACESQINISKEAAKCFSEEYKDSPLPGHTAFKQLAIIEEKRKNFDRAIELSKRAKQEGWAGDWDKRIIRLEKNEQINLDLY